MHQQLSLTHSQERQLIITDMKNNKLQSNIETLQFVNQLLLLECLIPNRKDPPFPMLCPVLHLDPSSLRPAMQIQLENREAAQNSSKSRVLYQRAHRLQDFVKQGKSLLELAFQQFNSHDTAEEISLELSPAKQKQLLGGQRQASRRGRSHLRQNSRSHNIVQKNTVSIVIEGQKNNESQKELSKKSHKKSLELKLNDENFNYSNTEDLLISAVHSQSKTSKMQNSVKIKELKRSEYHRNQHLLQEKRSMVPIVTQITQGQQIRQVKRSMGPLYQNSGRYQGSERKRECRKERFELKKIVVPPRDNDANHLRAYNTNQYTRQPVTPKIWNQIIAPVTTKSMSKPSFPHNYDRSVSPKFQRNKSVSPAPKQQTVQNNRKQECQKSRTLRHMEKVKVEEINYSDQERYTPPPTFAKLDQRERYQNQNRYFQRQKLQFTQDYRRPATMKQIHTKCLESQSSLQNYMQQHYPTRKQQMSIYVQTDSAIKPQQDTISPKQSLDLLNKIVQKTDRSFSVLGKEITGIRQAISQLGESRNSERMKKELQERQQFMTKVVQSKKSKRANHQFSQPHTVQQQQVWECEEDELEEQINRINQQISSRNLHNREESAQITMRQKQKTPRNSTPCDSRKVNQVETRKQPRSSLLLEPQRNYITTKTSFNQTKCVQLNLTPDRAPSTPNHKQKSLNIEIDMTKIEGVPKKFTVGRQYQPNNNSPNRGIYTESKTISHRAFEEDSYLAQKQEVVCSKWKKSKKKQLLSMKIANLRD